VLQDEFEWPWKGSGHIERDEQILAIGVTPLNLTSALLESRRHRKVGGDSPAFVQSPWAVNRAKTRLRVGDVTGGGQGQQGTRWNVVVVASPRASRLVESENRVTPKFGFCWLE